MNSSQGSPPDVALTGVLNPPETILSNREELAEAYVCGSCEIIKKNTRNNKVRVFAC